MANSTQDPETQKPKSAIVPGGTEQVRPLIQSLVNSEDTVWELVLPNGEREDLPGSCKAKVHENGILVITEQNGDFVASYREWKAIRRIKRVIIKE